MFNARSFRSKLVFSYAFVIIVSFAFVAFFLDKRLEENSLKEIKSSLITEANLIVNQIPSRAIKNEDIVYLESLSESLKPISRCRLTIINAQGRVLADSERSHQEIMQMENHLSRPEVKTALSGMTGVETRYSATLKTDMLYAALPIKDNLQVAGVLRLALPLHAVQKTLLTTRKTVVLGLLFALCFAFLLGSLVAARTMAPVNRMIQVSRKFSEGDFSRRILQISDDEIGQLAATLNRMAQEIEDKLKKIEAQNQELAAIFSSMIEGVIVTDKEGRLISVNPSIERLLRVKRQDIEGRLLLEAIRNNDLFEVVDAVLSSGRPVSRDLELLVPVQKSLQVNATPFFQGVQVSGCLAVIHDITEMRRLENMRRDFVANVSHELKTPLTSIKGFIETLLEGALEDKANSRKFLEIIQEHANRLNSLINDLLDLSAIESKKAGLVLEEIKLRDLAEQALSGFNSQLKKRSIKVRDELADTLEVKADRGRLEQVLVNLIDNAIKFNKDKGSITIYAQELSGEIKTTIEDSGIGIPAKDVPRIFERFYRVDKARSRELGGTGLGLSIVKHIVELHGGSAGVESSEGLGSRFFFTLPKHP